ncbi:MAG: diaminopimelate epimerase [Planctomycetes bacterium]|nr:diaminopimelate epimerase [Planctomycetota bacterium]
MRFTKMHGIGNDYVYVNCFAEEAHNPAQMAITVSDRHTGIGSDGLILICPSETADVKMRMFNADGSESQMCGNGIRCVAKYTYDHELTAAGGTFSAGGQRSFERSLKVETGRGILTLGLEIGDDGKVSQVCVNMGQPILKGLDIPVNIAAEQVVDHDIEIDDQQLSMTCVSMGNPHAVIFCSESVEDLTLDKVGPLIENHELFPERVNAHFVKIDGPNELTMRTWERGSGITLACGTGACAVAVAGVLSGRCERNVVAHLPGGDLDLNWCQDDNCVYMTGGATEVFSGEF